MPESNNQKFNHLKIHTQYSICEGAIKIDELKNFCKEKKIQSLGLSDTSNLCGALEFAENISKVGTQPIIGTQIYFKFEDTTGLLPLIALNENGYKKIIELSKQDALTKIGIEFFEPGRFITLKDGAVFYSKERLGNNRFIEVFMQTEIDGEVSVVTAEYAEIQGDQGNNLLVFFNGQRYQGKPGDDDFRVLEFSEHQLPLFISKTKKEINNIAIESIDTLLGQSDLESKAEVQWRLSPPIALLILVFLAVPLSKASPRQGQYGGLVLGVLVYLIYVNLLGAARVWFEQGDSPQVIGLWWVHSLGFIFTLLMILNSYNFFSRLTTMRETK